MDRSIVMAIRRTRPLALPKRKHAFDAEAAAKP
jgi:hypothetical protein